MILKNNILRDYINIPIKYYEKEDGDGFGV